MRDPQQPRRRWPGPVLGLMLAVALAACGQGGDAADESGTAAAGDSAQVQVAAATDTTCAPPPSPPQHVVKEGAPWAGLEAFLADSGVSFPDTPENTATDTVPMCLGCTSVGLRLQSTNRTYCMTPQASGQQRITGRLTLLETFPAQNDYDTIPAGAPVYMFTRGTPAPVQHALLVYEHQGKVKYAPLTAWRFYYCTHQPGGNKPQAQWRPENLPQGQEGGSGDGGSYAWMSCANGCCQFYTPPPIAEFPELPEKGKTPDAQPGSDGNQLPPPKWCVGPNHS
jgi:hypothetical protein